MIKGTFIVVLFPVILLALFSLIQFLRTSKLLSERNNPTANKMSIETTALIKLISTANILSLIITGLLMELIFISGIVNVPHNFVSLILHYLVILLIYTTISDFIFRVVSYIYIYFKVRGQKDGNRR